MGRKFGHTLDGGDKKLETSNSIYLIQGIPLKKMQSKMCRNALGMNKNVPDHLVKAEMGAFPMMGLFIKRMFSYWQHILDLYGKITL